MGAAVLYNSKYSYNMKQSLHHQIIYDMITSISNITTRQKYDFDPRYISKTELLPWWSSRLSTDDPKNK